MSTPSIKELRQARAREGQTSPVWRRVVFTAVGLVVFYIIAGFFIAPPIVRSQLEKRLAAELGRTVHVRKVSLNPLTLSGAVEGFAVLDRDGKQNFVAWKRAFANFDAVSFLVGEWRFDELTLDGAEAAVAVDREGKLSFADILSRISSAPASPASSRESRPLRVRRLNVSGARVEYREDTASQPFVTVVGPMTFALRDFSTGGKSDAPGEFSAKTESGESISWRGTLAVAPLRSSGEFSLGDIVLKKYMPYVERFLNAAITDGTLAVRSRYEIVFAGEKPGLKVQDGSAQVTGFKLGAPGAAEPAIAFDLLNVSGVAADTAAQTAIVARVALTGGRVAANRDATGIDLLRLLQPKAPVPAGGSSGAGVSPPAASATSRPFDAKLGELVVANLAVTLNDTTTPRAARQEFEQVSLTVKNVSLANLSALSPVEFGARITGGGTVRVSGNVAPQPLKGDLSVELEKAPLASISPYVESFANVRITNGTVSTKARLLVDSPAAKGLPVVTAQADLSVDDFATLAGAGSESLASWKKLSVRGIEAVTAPSLKVLIADIEWTDLSGSVIIDEGGALNLAGLMKTPAEAPPATGVSFQRSPAAPAPAPLPFIAIDRFQLNNAAFTYLDRSMEPDVKLVLSQLGGSVSGLSSASLARADVDVQGKVDGVAPVSIRGQINPLASEAFTDLKVDFAGINLLPAGPYVGRYAGYQLDRGALTLDVRVKLSQRRLDTNNVVTLDQFTLGEKTSSPDATNLPVGLALALLRDRQGKIVLDVPVQGSLDDPEFRVGRVVVRVIVNLLTKAATSPFSLIGSMFGGGQKSEELAFQEFIPGTAELTEASLPKLEVVAKALNERPALRLDIAGAYSVAVDTPVLRERELENGLRVALWEELRKSAPAGAAVPPPEQVTLTPEARSRIIGIFYRAAFEPENAGEKPESASAELEAAADPGAKERKRELAPVVRQFRRGSAPAAPAASAPRVMKAPPPRPLSSTSTVVSAPAASAAPAGPTTEEMRAKLVAAIPIHEDMLRELAAERARRVRAFLVDENGIAAERVSLSAPTSKGPRVDLQLK